MPDICFRCSSGFDRHRQDWVDNSCPDEVSSQKFVRIVFLFERLHTAMTALLILQTKDKMCDIIDTTYLYPFTTTIVAKTTSRSKEATAGRDAPSTSHPPTSVPTEGKVEYGAGTRPRCILFRSPNLTNQTVMDAVLWQDVK